MNPDKSFATEHDPIQPSLDLEVDSIPTLDEALDLSDPDRHDVTPPMLGLAETAPFEANLMDKSDVPTPQPEEMELSVDLGYAEVTEDFVESDDLAEMEEIQTLPLAEMVLDDEQDALVSAEHQRQIATLEAIVFEGENPNAPAPKSNLRTETPLAAPTAEASEEHPVEPTHATESAFTPAMAPTPANETGKPLPKKSENPFLPQHILDRLNQGKRNLVEEIAQSSAALDASTAILRTHARTDRLSRASFSEKESKAPYSFSRDKSAQQKQKIVDDLVDEYLPLIAAELRRRLRKILDE